MSYIDVDAYVIANGAAITGQINLGDKALHGVAFDANFTGTNASFQISPDGGTTWFEGPVIAAAASQYIQIDPTFWRAVTCIKVRAGTSGSPTTQSSNTTISIISKRIW